MNNRLRLLGSVLLALPAAAIAQIVPNNSYSMMLNNTNAMLQLSISQTIAAQGQTKGYGTSRAPAPCLPPIELQRGVDGHVPPELQGDPRYQQYLRCRQGQPDQQYVAPTPPSGPSASTAPPARYDPQVPAAQLHAPIFISDFVPATYGHPLIDQSIATMGLSFREQVSLRSAVNETFAHVANEVRPNNLAASMAYAICASLYVIRGAPVGRDELVRYVQLANDSLASSPGFINQSPAQKQANSDTLILDSTLILVLRNLGQRDAASARQAADLARAVLQRLGVSS
jgi:hypothetical protein